MEEIIKKINRELNKEELRSYIVSPLLKELAKENEKKASSNNKEELIDAYNIYVYIADVYTRMVRMSLSAIYRYKSLEVAAKLYKQYEFVPEYLANNYRMLLRDRNFYIDDDAEDVLNLVKEIGFLPTEVVDTYYQAAMKRRRGLKNDPVEMSEEYLAVIDEVEEKIAKNRTLFGMGACYEIWALKEQYLLEKGIIWKSPHILNPGVMFD